MNNQIVIIGDKTKKAKDLIKQLLSQTNLNYIVTEIQDNDPLFKGSPDYTLIFSLNPKREGYLAFLSQTQKLNIANISDTSVANILKDVMKETDTPAIDFSKSDFMLNLKDKKLEEVAKAVFHLGLALEIDTNLIRESLEEYAN